jgi:lambda family phage portal protein
MLGFTRQKRDVFDVIFGNRADEARREFQPDPTHETAADTTSAPVASSGGGAWRYDWHDGEKWDGGFGPTRLLLTDYWTLRARSAELFERNLYARGLIRRLVTNVINTGLHLEATPEESVLGYEKDGLSEWTEEVEIRFSLWANEPRLCDATEKSTWGALQAQAYLEALVAGDVLVLLTQDPRTKLPRVRLISGESIQTPMTSIGGQLPNGNRIVHGVELDSTDRHVAYHVRQKDGTSKRLPAWGEKSGRRLAFLVYACDKRLDDVRGQPLLALVLQSLKELDRYRDASLRKAVINSILAMFIKRDVDSKKGPSRSMAAAGTRKGSLPVIDEDLGTSDRSFKFSGVDPGVVIEVLKPGEEPVPHPQQAATEGYATFEDAIICTIAWSHGIPPETLRLTFNSNYSASQAATNEFRMALNPWRVSWGDGFCQPVYTDWLISSVLAKKIAAPGFLDTWADGAQLELFAAWVSSDWAGQIKPSINMVDHVKALNDAVEANFMTRSRAAREFSGMKFSKIVATNKLENAQMAEANTPLAELKAKEKPTPAPSVAPKPSRAPDGSPPADNQNDNEPTGESATPTVN